MFNTSSQLVLDVKAQDRLRQWFSQRGSLNNVVITAFELGDSDVDYRLSLQPTEIQVLNAPYQVQQIKYKLIFTGSAANVTGQITSYLRYVDNTGSISSLYGYPPTTSFSSGSFPPVVTNGYNWNNISFGTVNGPNNREGYILFLQTLPTGYTEPDPSNPLATLPLRLIEPYDFSIQNLPSPNMILSTTGTGIPVVVTVNTPINNADIYALASGNQIAISGIAGNAIANGLYYIQVLSSTTFALFQDSGLTIPIIGNGNYTSGGQVFKWFVSIDETDGSLLIARGAFPLFGGTNGLITITGSLSGISTQISFNY